MYGTSIIIITCLFTTTDNERLYTFTKNNTIDNKYGCLIIEYEKINNTITLSNNNIEYIYEYCSDEYISIYIKKLIIINKIVFNKCKINQIDKIIEYLKTTKVITQPYSLKIHNKPKVYRVLIFGPNVPHLVQDHLQFKDE